MDKTNEWTEDDRLQALSETREKLAEIEREFKYWRQQSRTLTVELITKHGFSVLRASQLSGHNRQTVKIWLDLYNAERKGAGLAQE